VGVALKRLQREGERTKRKLTFSFGYGSGDEQIRGKGEWFPSADGPKKYKFTYLIVEE